MRIIALVMIALMAIIGFVSAVSADCPDFEETNPDVSLVDGSFVEFTTVPRVSYGDGDGNGAWLPSKWLWTCDGSEWKAEKYRTTMGLPAGAVLEMRITNLENKNEILSAYAYL